MFRIATFLLVFAAAFGTAATGAAQTVPHRESAEGQVVNLVNPTATTAGRLDWIAKGNANQMGLYTVPKAGHDFIPIDFTKGLVTNGSFTDVAADGSTISGTYAGTYTFTSPTTARFDVQVNYAAGTGRLAGVTGSGIVVSILDLTTGRFHYETNATWKLR